MTNSDCRRNRSSARRSWCVSDCLRRAPGAQSVAMAQDSGLHDRFAVQSDPMPVMTGPRLGPANRSRFSVRAAWARSIAHETTGSIATLHAENRFRRRAWRCTADLTGLHSQRFSQRATACKAPRQPWHSRQTWQRRICNLQILKNPAPAFAARCDLARIPPSPPPLKYRK